MNTFNQWTSKSDQIRDSKSPQDLVTAFRRIPNFTGTVDVPFAEGTRVLIYPVMEGIVVVNGVTGVHEVTFDFTDGGGTPPFAQPVAGVMVQAKAQQEQTPFTNI